MDSGIFKNYIAGAGTAISDEDLPIQNNILDANTILKADTEHVPVALSVPVQTLVGRITAGVIDALTITEVQTLLSLPASTTHHHGQHEAAGTDAIKLDDLYAPDNNTDLNASTSKHGLLLKATAPASGLYNYVGITNGETVYTNKALFDATVPAVLGTAAAGTAIVAARRDHVHTLPKLDDMAAAEDNTDLNATTTTHGLLLKATAPAATLRNIVAIDNAETAYPNKALFDATVPAALGTAAAGTAMVAARRDHVHTNPAIDTLAAATDITTLDATTSAHGLLVKATAPAATLMNFVGITNGETSYTNKPLFDTTLPEALGTAAAGSAVIAARRDHVHTLPKLDDLAAAEDNTDLDATTTTHGLLLKATAPAAGLINVVAIANAETAYTNKALFDATAPTTQAFSDAADVGTATVAARRDHKHAMMNGDKAATVVDGSANATLTAANCYGTMISNYGQAAADVHLDLPTAAAGLNFIAIVGTAQAANFWKLRADTNDKIYLDGVAGSDNGYVGLAAPAVGDYATFITFQTGANAWDWICKSGYGTWVAS